jgi:hypothetical protein
MIPQGKAQQVAIPAHQMMIVLPMSAEGIQKVVMLSEVRDLVMHVPKTLTVYQDIVVEATVPLE